MCTAKKRGVCARASFGGYFKLRRFIPANLETEWQVAENFTASSLPAENALL